ncbi:MAG: tetratricopeptide repeat protein [bacterium]
MGSKLTIYLAGLLIPPLLLTACAGLNTPPPTPEMLYHETVILPVDVDSVGLDEFHDLSAREQADRRRQAEKLLEKARELNEREEWWWEWLTVMDLNPAVHYALYSIYGSGRLAAWCMFDLQKAVSLDPSGVEAWQLLAKISGAVGDWQRSEHCLEMALLALNDRTAEPDRERRLRILLDFTWLCRDLGRLAEATLWLDQAEPIAGDDPELQLLRGLVLAEQGHFQAALEVVARLAPVPYARYGYGMSVASHEGRWISSLAYLARGETKLAAYVMGHVNIFRITVPHVHRYLNDMGMVAEAAGWYSEARSYYQRAGVLTPYVVYFPLSGYDGMDSIYGQRGTGVPFYISYSNFYVAGSLYNYAAHTLARYETTTDPAEKQELARTAMMALNACVERQIKPIASLSLRGQLHYLLDQPALAAADLERAYVAGASSGQTDSWACLFLGLLQVNEGDYEASLPYLQQAVAADSSLGIAWRNLGVALLNTGDLAGGRVAFDYAIAQDPGSASTWFNRGLLSCNEQRWGEAYRDLEVAFRLAPDNPDILRLLQKAGSAWRQADGSPGHVPVGGSSGAAARTPGADATVASVPGGTSSAGGQGTGQRRTSAAEARLDPAAYAAALPDLLATYRDNPSPDHRLDLARAYVRSGQPEQTLDILLPLWEDGLSSAGRSLVIEADRALGRADRALDLARSLGDAAPAGHDSIFWSLVAFTCLDLGHPGEGLQALEAALNLDPENIALQTHHTFLRSQLQQ